jgi:hypothetical protein
MHQMDLIATLKHPSKDPIPLLLPDVPEFVL